MELITSKYKVKNIISGYSSPGFRSEKEIRDFRVKIAFEVQQLIIDSKTAYHNWLSSLSMQGKHQTHVYDSRKLNNKRSQDDFSIARHEPGISVESHRLRADSL